MKLTREQRSALISEMASSEAGFNELVRVLLDSFSKQEGKDEENLTHFFRHYHLNSVLKRLNLYEPAHINV